jgi:hypothetical protein
MADKIPEFEQQMTVKGGGGKSFTLSYRDILALGVFLLALGAVLVAIIIAIFWGFGKIQAHDAKEVITVCVGGSAISGLATAILKKK